MEIKISLTEDFSSVESVALIDMSGKEIEFPKCKCGKTAYQCLMGKEVHVWMCDDCLYPNDQTKDVKLIYNPEYGKSS